MPCYYPVGAWRAKKPNPDTGRYGVTFKPSEGGDPVELPCGKCVGCRSTHRRDWAIRCMHEAQGYMANGFVTLTYNDDHLPSDLKISKDHFRSFLKNLRKLTPSDWYRPDEGYLGPKFRYYGVGEYGEKTRRPHYHLLIFGANWHEDAAMIHRNEDHTRSFWTSPILTEAWEGKGFVRVDNMSYGSASYVTGYTNKKLGDDDTFALMSKRPAIGRKWLEENWQSIDDQDNSTVFMNGNNYPAPSVYFKWMEEELMQAKQRRINSVGQYKKDGIQLRHMEINQNSVMGLKPPIRKLNQC